jgi:hypothetical protein
MQITHLRRQSSHLLDPSPPGKFPKSKFSEAPPVGHDAVEIVSEYGGMLEDWVVERPLTAIAVSVAVAAILARYLFRRRHA